MNPIFNVYLYCYMHSKFLCLYALEKAVEITSMSILVLLQSVT